MVKPKGNIACGGGKQDKNDHSHAKKHYESNVSIESTISDTFKAHG